MKILRNSRAKRLYVSKSLRQQLQQVARAATSAVRDVLRARIILLAAAGHNQAEIARQLHCTDKTVRKWCHRFRLNPSLKSLRDAARSGRPAEVPVTVRCMLIKIACDRPPGPFRQCWTLSSLSQSLHRETGWWLSRSEVRRILQTKDIRPHRMRLWLHSPDPEFAAKVRFICGLYRYPPPGATVLCVDEKTGMQALERKYPTRWPGPGQAGHWEYEYIRHGTRALIASWDIRTGRVLAQCGPRRTADDLLAFMEMVAQRYPTGPVYIIWDNLNIHYGKRWEGFNQRHGERFHFVYTPLHASWVNQIEIWFSILQRRLLKYGSFTSAEDLTSQVLAFIAHWNAREAHPFRWQFRGVFQQATSVAA